MISFDGMAILLINFGVGLMIYLAIENFENATFNSFELASNPACETKIGTGLDCLGTVVIPNGCDMAEVDIGSCLGCVYRMNE